MSLGTIPELTLRLFEVRYKCAGQPGIRQIWAPSERSASRVLRDHPSAWGLPSETVIVVSVREKLVRPLGVNRAA